MYLVTLRDDCFNAGGFVRISGVISAIAQHFVSIGECDGRLQAERKAWPHVHAAIVNGHLHPKSEGKLQPLKNDESILGVVILAELMQWFKLTGIFKLKLAISTETRLRAFENQPVQPNNGAVDDRVAGDQIADTKPSQDGQKVGAGGTANNEDPGERRKRFAQMRKSGMSGADIANAEGGTISATRANELCREGQVLIDKESKLSTTMVGMLGVKGAATSRNGVAAQKTKTKSP